MSQTLPECIGDVPNICGREDLIREALARCGVVILTGGLGPTDDDRTREAVARALEAPLERDDAEVARLRALFESRGRPFSEHQARQACRPRGAAWIANAMGTAPGFRVASGASLIAAFPGVPAEMRAMFERDLAPVLARVARGGLARRTLKIAGRLESSVDRAIADLYALPGVTITILAGLAGIELHVLVEDRDAGRARERLEDIDREIAGRFGLDLFGRDDETLAAVVGLGLRSAGANVAVAESCTAGLLAAALTSVPGSSAWFRGGLLVYDDDLKVRLAGVSTDTLAARGAVSAEVAAELAAGARERCAAGFGVGVTGIAGPEGARPDKPVGTVYVAVADRDGVLGKAAWMPGDRAMVRGRTVTLALDTLRRRLVVRP